MSLSSLHQQLTACQRASKPAQMHIPASALLCLAKGACRLPSTGEHGAQRWHFSVTHATDTQHVLT